MNQKIERGSDNIQINGNDNSVSLGEKRFQPDPVNPNLINCPGCGKYGIHYEADVCPECGYSFKNKRIEAQEQARRQFETGMRTLLVLLALIVSLAIVISSYFHGGLLQSLAGSFMLVLLGYMAYLWIVVKVSNSI